MPDGLIGNMVKRLFEVEKDCCVGFCFSWFFSNRSWIGWIASTVPQFFSWIWLTLRRTCCEFVDPRLIQRSSWCVRAIKFPGSWHNQLGLPFIRLGWSCWPCWWNHVDASLLLNTSIVKSTPPPDPLVQLLYPASLFSPLWQPCRLRSAALD